tara:strand:- start:224 stop:1321 length:1098 start_codon:yes stop_codon:yes gene_type:complete
MSRAREFADLAGSADAGGITGRNLVINGAATVNQLGTKTGLTGDAYFIDRFKWGVTNLGTWTASQDTDTPDGFAHSAKIECTTADASPAAADFCYLYTRFEGQDLQHLKFGTSAARPITISFYVKCTKTGVFTVNWRNQDAGRSIGSDVTINSANTWEYKTITFAGDTSGSFNNDNGWSANLEFMLNGGTNYTSGSTHTSYASHSNTDGTRAGGTTLALGAAVGDIIRFTGVQLEVGEQATPFEHRSFADELQRCIRYLYRIETDSANGAFVNLTGWDTNNTYGSLRFPVEMRASPSFSYGAALSDFLILSAGANPTPTTIQSNGNSKHGIELNMVSTSNITAGRSYWARIVDTSNGFVQFDAEL